MSYSNKKSLVILVISFTIILFANFIILSNFKIYTYSQTNGPLREGLEEERRSIIYSLFEDEYSVDITAQNILLEDFKNL